MANVSLISTMQFGWDGVIWVLHDQDVRFRPADELDDRLLGLGRHDDFTVLDAEKLDVADPDDARRLPDPTLAFGTAHEDRGRHIVTRLQRLGEGSAAFDDL
jgi:hypothetical protein